MSDDPKDLKEAWADIKPQPADLQALYHRVMGMDPDFSRGTFTVRLFDGMDGCWTDLPEATNVPADVACEVWAKRTENGTVKIRFNEIDYFRIFEGDTRMAWDGSEGREMFR